MQMKVERHVQNLAWGSALEVVCNDGDSRREGILNSYCENLAVRLQLFMRDRIPKRSAGVGPRCWGAIVTAKFDRCAHA